MTFRRAVVALLAATLLWGVVFALVVCVLPRATGVEPAPDPRPAGPIPFGVAAELAAADVSRLPPPIARQTRYLDASPRATDPEDLAELYAVVSDHVNGLSREAEIVKPRKVTPWLWAVNLDDYQWARGVFGDLARVNHYHLIPLTVGKEETFGPMFGTNPAAFKVLVDLTGSRTPIIRADNFLRRTGIQAGEDGHGYYDFLGLGDKKLATLEKFTRVDRKGSRETLVERDEVVPSSGVANPEVDRLILVLWALKRPWFETRDAKGKKGDRNVHTHRLDDFKFDARMVIFTLFNGMPGSALDNSKGDLVDSAPDTIATDTGATNTDHRVHVGYSCWSCHDKAGLKSFYQWSRNVYRASTGLRFVTPDGIDPKLAREQRVGYLADLTSDFERAEADYSAAVLKASGLKPAERAAAWRRQWQKYYDPVTLSKAAAECGVTPEVFLKRFRAWADPVPGDESKQRVIDPDFGPLLKTPPDAMDRFHWEEKFPVAMQILGGANP